MMVHTIVKSIHKIFCAMNRMFIFFAISVEFNYCYPEIRHNIYSSSEYSGFLRSFAFDIGHHVTHAFPLILSFGMNACSGVFTQLLVIEFWKQLLESVLLLLLSPIRK